MGLARAGSSRRDRVAPRRARLAFLLLLAAALLGLGGFLITRSDAFRYWLLARTPVTRLRSQAAASGASAWDHYALGHALAAQKNYREAVESFATGLNALDQKDDRALRARLDGELAECLVALGDDRNAIGYLKRALELDVGNVPAQMALGRVLMRREEYEVAARQFQIVTILEPKNAEGWYMLGKAHNEARKPDEAEPPLQKAIALAPHESRYLAELGHAFAYRSRFAEAQGWFERAVRENPKDQEAAGALARVKVLQARTPEEYRASREALLPFAEEAGGNAFYLGQLGILDLQFGNLPEAERTLKRAVELKPDYPEAMYNLALVYTRTGRPAASRETMAKFQRLEELHRKVVGLRKRLSLAPQDRAMNLELARSLVAQSNWREARQQYTYLLRIYPNDAEARADLQRLAQTHGAQMRPQEPDLP
jgi:Flp pilus assembly protein TadD